MRVYHRHVRSMGLCNKGLRKWLSDRGVDWNDFLENGVDANILTASGDHPALEAVRIATEEANEIAPRIDPRESVKKGGCV